MSVVMSGQVPACHAPYSRRRARCVLDTDIGPVVGVSLEDAAYPNSICAVRAAASIAIAKGAKKISAVTVENGELEAMREWGYGGRVEPCGACLEVLREFCDEETTEVTVTALIEEGKEAKSETRKLKHFLPPAVVTGAASASAFKGGVVTVPESALQTIASLEKCSRDFVVPEGFTFDEVERLALAAARVAARAYVPVSKFPVGVAMYVKGAGRSEADIVVGINVEDAVLGLGLCGERTTLSRAVAQWCETHRTEKFPGPAMVAVILPAVKMPGRPCGACRQSLVEWGDYPVAMLTADPENRAIDVQMSTTFKILPDCFSAVFLE